MRQWRRMEVIDQRRIWTWIGLRRLIMTFLVTYWHFNGVFETKISLWQALQEICRPMLARPVEQPGGKYTIVIDAEAAGPSAMFTMANIEKGSFRLDHTGYTSDTTDAVTITFKDEEQDYRDTSITLIPDQSAGLNPAERTIRGVTAYRFRLAGRLAHGKRKQISPHISATWRTGLEGYLPIYGDTVRCSALVCSAQTWGKGFFWLDS